MSILIYAFSNRWGTNISRRALSELKNIPSLFQNKTEIHFEPIFYHPGIFFRKFINGTNYPLIIGLGDFYGNSNKIHIETRAKNAYLNRPIHPLSPIFLELSLPAIDLYDPSIFQLSYNMGTYNCNWITYQIQLFLNHHNPSGYQLFFHLPQKSNASLLASEIQKLLKLNKIYQNGPEI